MMGIYLVYRQVGMGRTIACAGIRVGFDCALRRLHSELGWLSQHCVAFGSVRLCWVFPSERDGGRGLRCEKLSVLSDLWCVRVAWDGVREGRKHELDKDGLRFCLLSFIRSAGIYIISLCGWLNMARR